MSKSSPKPFRPVADAQQFAQNVRGRLNPEQSAEQEGAAISQAPAFASPATWRPKLLFAMRPPAPRSETPATASFDAGEKAARMTAELAHKRGAKPVDANAVAARVYELMREEARLATMRGAWSPRRRN